MISDSITQKIQDAMRAKDEVRLSTLRMLSSALNYEKIAKQHDLSEEEEIAVVKKEAKKRKDAIEAYEKAGAVERADKEREELVILQEYLPAEMSNEELEKIVSEVVASAGDVNMSMMGKLIGEVMQKTQGRADGSRVAELIKSKLTQSNG